ncbi:MAG: hypothetical protein UT33_C0014G0033 [Candidatus Peregrinibacteria bacterium GW2011_GWC2_39_14]|nr:MAG: hypothetical protein US92_C0008G0033 [Candidatus Peregrinibacteria bacterium GW2011_GWA2_38_36]KKR05035.1 MAG: hypothetical protein UT33_C0014G0033 [Candidatus Peregrinibacteria bacterium GW2011_GWC2_39_14]
MRDINGSTIEIELRATENIERKDGKGILAVRGDVVKAVIRVTAAQRSEYDRGASARSFFGPTGAFAVIGTVVEGEGENAKPVDVVGIATAAQVVSMPERFRERVDMNTLVAGGAPKPVKKPTRPSGATVQQVM